MWQVEIFLASIEFISKFFLLSPHGSSKSPSWKEIKISNVFILFGFAVYFCFHLTYVANNDLAVTRVKLVTFFIDNYNKYSGLFLVTVIILVQYFNQSMTAEINKMFVVIDKIFAEKLSIKIQSAKSMR